MSNDLAQQTGALSLNGSSTASSPSGYLHFLDLFNTTGEDAAIDLNQNAPNYSKLNIAESTTIGQVKTAIATSTAKSELTAQNIRLVFLRHQPQQNSATAATISGPRPLTDLSDDKKTLKEYDITSDSWILIKQKHTPAAEKKTAEKEEEEIQFDDGDDDDDLNADDDDDLNASDPEDERPTASTRQAKVSDVSQLLPTAGWECDTCLVRNPESVQVCACCETPRPGAASGEQLTQSSFFSAAPAGVSFGAPTTASEPAPAAGGVAFNFSPSTAAPTFGFDASALTAPTFGSNAAPAAATSGFSFGAPATEKK